MSTTIDQKVVEMRFDNSQFEKNVSTSMSTIDKLKAKLNFKESANSFEELSRASDKVNFNGMSSALDQITVKFNALEAVGIHVLTRLADKALDAGEKMVKGLTIDQVMSGYNKYEQKTRDVQTIMNATGKSVEEVDKYLEKLMWFSDETSYGFTDMTSSLATLLSSGADIDRVIPMITGMANATALAGKGASEFSRAIFNLNQSYGGGYLTLLDWRSISQAAPSEDITTTIIETAKELGRLNDQYETAEGHIVNVGTFTDTLKDKWADREVLEAAFGKFSEMSEEVYKLTESGQYKNAAEAMQALDGQYSEIAQKAFEAAQQCKTFSDAVDATKDAVSSNWMRIFESVFGDFEEARELWTEFCDDLWDIFAAPIDNAASTIEMTMGDPIKAFRKQMEDAGVDMNTMTSKLIDYAKATGQYTDAVLTGNETFEDLVSMGIVTTDSISKVLNEYTASVVTGTQKMQDFEEVVHRVMQGDFGDGEQRIQALTDLGYDYAKVQDLVNDVIYNGTANFIEYSDAELEAIGLTEDEIAAIRELGKQAAEIGTPLNELIGMMGKPSGRVLLIDTFRMALHKALDIINIVREAWANVFGGTTASQIRDTIERIHSFVDSLELSDEQVNNLRSTFEGLFSILDIGKKILGAAFDVAKHFISLLAPAGNAILDVTGSLGEYLKKLDDTIDKNGLFSTAVEVLNTGLDYLFKIAEKAKEGIMNLFKAFTGVDLHQFESLRDIFASIGTRLTELGTKAKENFPTVFEFLDNLKLKLKGSEDSTRSFGDVFDDVFGRIKETASKIWSGISPIFEGIVSFLKGVFEQIQEVFGGVTAQDIIGTGALVGLYQIAKKIVDALNIPIKDLVTAFTSVLDTARESLKLWQKEIKADILLKIAVAVGVLAASVFVLSRVDPERAAQAFGGVTVLLGEVVAIVAILSKMNAGGKLGEALSSGTNLTIMSGAMVKVAAALFVIAGAFKLLEGVTIEGNKVTALMMVLGEVAGSIYLFEKDLTKNNMTDTGFGKNIKAIGKSIVSVAIALLGVAGAITILGKLSPEELKQGFSVATIIMVELGLFMASMKMGQTDIKGIAGSIIAIAVALNLLIVPILALGYIPYEKVMQGMEATIGLMIALAGSLTLIKSVPGDLKGVATSLLAMAVALNLLLIPITALGLMDFGMLLQGLAGLGIAMIELAGSLAIIKSIPGDMSGIASSVLAMAVAMTLLMVPIKVFSEMSLPELGTGILGLALGLIAIAGAAELLAPVTEKLDGLSKALLKFGIAALALAGAVALFTIAFSAISAMGDTAVTVIEDVVLTICTVLQDMAGPIAETILIVISELLQALIDYTPTIVNQAWDWIISIIHILTERVPELIGALGEFFDALFGAADETGVEKAAVMVGLIAIAGLIVKEFAAIAKDVPKSLIGVAGVAAIMVVVGGLLAAMTLLPVDEVLIVATSLTEVILAVTLAIELLSKIPVKGALTAIEDLGIFVGGMTLLLAALGGINAIPGVDWLMDKGIDLLGKVGTAIGSFVGNIIGGFNEGFTSTLPQVGQNLSDFMTNMGPFIDMLPKFASSMMELSVAGMIEKFSSLFGGGSLATFVEELGESAEPLKKYGDKIQGIGDYKDDMMIAVDVIAGLAEATKKIPNEGGLLGKIVGENGVAEFAQYMSDAAPKIMAYAETVNGLSTSYSLADTEMLADILEELAAAAKKLPNEGGVLADLIGDNQLGKFAKNLIPLGINILTYAMEVNGLSNYKKKDATRAVEIISDIAEVANEIPNSGGVVSWFTGNNNLEDFAKILPDVGSYVMAYAQSVDGIAAYWLDIKAVNSILEGLSKVGDFMGDSSFAFMASMGELGNQSVSEFLRAFTDSHEETEEAVGDLIEYVLDALEQKVKDTKRGFEDLGSKSIEGFNSPENETSAKQAGEKTSKNIADGITSKASEAKKAVSTMAEQCISNMKSFYTQFSNAGAYLTQGFANGLQSKAASVRSAAQSIANSAASSMRTTLDEHSPSAIGHEIGAFLGEGFGNGIIDMAGYVDRVSTKLAQTAEYGLEDALDSTLGLTDGLIDTQPVIRPVFDLSEIQNGSIQLNRLMSSLSGRSVNGTVSVATRTASGISRGKDTVTVTPVPTGRTVTETVTNHFHITGSNPQEIAREVSSILQKDVERRKAAWA